MDTTCKICNHNFKIHVENLEGVLSRCPRCGSVQQFPAQTDVIKSEDDRTKIFENIKDGRVLGGKISIINKEGGIYKHVILKKGLTVIGRNLENKIYIGSEEFLIEDLSISRKHLSIEMQKGKSQGETIFLLCDCESKNGVYLNGLKLNGSEKVYLNHDDIISVGNLHLRFTNIKV
ncbi:MAG TPA: FHA domain-containing protein [Saprospiraceae bacterium]|nr:FHA domain-containing protein [Saprospiraceae bacterium]